MLNKSCYTIHNRCFDKSSGYSRFDCINGQWKAFGISFRPSRAVITKVINKL